MRISSEIVAGVLDTGPCSRSDSNGEPQERAGTSCSEREHEPDEPRKLAIHPVAERRDTFPHAVETCLDLPVEAAEIALDLYHIGLNMLDVRFESGPTLVHGFLRF